MHVNYRPVLHFHHCLVVLLVEQLEVDSSLNDHRIYIYIYVYMYVCMYKNVGVESTLA